MLQKRTLTLYSTSGELHTVTVPGSATHMTPLQQGLLLTVSRPEGHTNPDSRICCLGFARDRFMRHSQLHSQQPCGGVSQCAAPPAWTQAGPKKTFFREPQQAAIGGEEAAMPASPLHHLMVCQQQWRQDLLHPVKGVVKPAVAQRPCLECLLDLMGSACCDTLHVGPSAAHKCISA